MQTGWFHGTNRMCSFRLKTPSARPHHISFSSSIKANNSARFCSVSSSHFISSDIKLRFFIKHQQLLYTVSHAGHNQSFHSRHLTPCSYSSSLTPRSVRYSLIFFVVRNSFADLSFILFPVLQRCFCPDCCGADRTASIESFDDGIHQCHADTNRLRYPHPFPSASRLIDQFSCHMVDFQFQALYPRQCVPKLFLNILFIVREFPA